MIVPRPVIKPKARAVVRRAIIISWRRRITVDRHAGRGGRRRLVHVEVNLLRYPVFWSHHMASLENSHLLKLIRGHRQCPHDIIVGAKIVEGAVWIAENLDVHRRSAHVLAISFDARAGCRRVNQYVISHCSVRSAFCAGWHRLTSSNERPNRGAGQQSPYSLHGRKIAENRRGCNSVEASAYLAWRALKNAKKEFLGAINRYLPLPRLGPKNKGIFWGRIGSDLE